MIKRQQLKVPLIVLLVLTAISTALYIAALVYQIVAGLIGFTGSPTTVTECTEGYLVTKLTRENDRLAEAFVGIGIGCVFAIASVVFMAMGCHNFRTRSKQLETFQEEADPLSKIRHHPEEEYDSFFTYSKLVAAYVFYSLSILGGIVHCGMILGLMISNKNCKGGGLKIQYLVIGILSSVSVLLMLVCWVILQTLRCKIHHYLNDNEELSVKLPNNTKAKGQPYRGQQMHTMEQLNPIESHEIRGQSSFQEIYQRKQRVDEIQDISNKPIVRQTRHQNIGENHHSKSPDAAKTVTPTFANNQAEIRKNEEAPQGNIYTRKNEQIFEQEEQSEQGRGFSNIYAANKKSPIKEDNALIKRSFLSPSRASPGRKQKTHSPRREDGNFMGNSRSRHSNRSPDVDFFEYMKQQNSPLKKEDVLEKQTNGRPYFKSPKRKENNAWDRQDDEDNVNDYQKGTINVPLNNNSSQGQRFRNNYYDKSEARGAQQYKKESQAVMRRQRKNYLEENNYSTILRKDSMHERENSQKNHPPFIKEVRPIEDPQARPQGKRKGLLIDYIRSKYAD